MEHGRLAALAGAMGRVLASANGSELQRVSRQEPAPWPRVPGIVLTERGASVRGASSLGTRSESSTLSVSGSSQQIVGKVLQHPRLHICDALLVMATCGIHGTTHTSLIVHTPALVCRHCAVAYAFVCPFVCTWAIAACACTCSIVDTHRSDRSSMHSRVTCVVVSCGRPLVTQSSYLMS